jgi:hypothetical protein
MRSIEVWFCFCLFCLLLFFTGEFLLPDFHPLCLAYTPFCFCFHRLMTILGGNNERLRLYISCIQTGMLFLTATGHGSKPWSVDLGAWISRVQGLLHAVFGD